MPPGAPRVEGPPSHPLVIPTVGYWLTVARPAYPLSIKEREHEKRLPHLRKAASAWPTSPKASDSESNGTISLREDSGCLYATVLACGQCFEFPCSQCGTVSVSEVRKIAVMTL